MNFGAMETKLNQNIKTAKMKERMRAKLEKEKPKEKLKNLFIPVTVVIIKWKKVVLILFRKMLL